MCLIVNVHAPVVWLGDQASWLIVVYRLQIQRLAASAVRHTGYDEMPELALAVKKRNQQRFELVDPW
jgi:hypothetical protein